MGDNIKMDLQEKYVRMWTEFSCDRVPRKAVMNKIMHKMVAISWPSE
jgi:hypothetical protein